MPHEWTEGTCVLPHRYDKPQHPPPASIGYCCKWCVERHRLWLTEITELYATLYEVLEPGSIPDTTAEHAHVKKRPASPAPMRLEAWAMLFDTDRLYRTGRRDDLPDIPAALSGWADWVFETHGYTAPAPTTVTGAVAVLSSNAEHIACQSFVDDYDAELGWLRSALRAAHGISEPKPLGACLTVDCTGRVWRDKDGGRPKCDRCGRRYGTLDIVRLHVHERTSA